MPPINDTGSVITVGPDVNGDHFSVEPGDEYTLPEPPRTVSDEEDEAQGEETPEEAPEDPLGSTKKPPRGTPPPGKEKNPPEGTLPLGDQPEDDGPEADTEGTPE